MLFGQVDEAISHYLSRCTMQLFTSGQLLDFLQSLPAEVAALTMPRILL